MTTTRFVLLKELPGFVKYDYVKYPGKILERQGRVSKWRFAPDFDQERNSWHLDVVVQPDGKHSKIELHYSTDQPPKWADSLAVCEPLNKAV
jgi:hypothetical protein